MHEERLHERAAADTGLDDFGDPGYREGLGVLLGAAGEHPFFDEFRDYLEGTVVSILRSRLSSQAAWAQRPDCLARELDDPVVIVGIPRTGTTLLHRLLELDRSFQVLQNWLIEAPMPRPPAATWAGHPGFQRAAERASANDAAQRAKHHVEPDHADECIRLMAQSFVSNLFGNMWPVPGYDAWFFAQDETPSYRRYADNLRLIGADDDRTWLLKNPSHVLAPDSLLAVFPRARLVQTHRDPLEAIPSVCSLVAGRRRKFPRSFDPLALGRDQLGRWSLGVRRMDDFRDRQPGRVVDVDYRELVADPVGVVRGLYASLGRELPDETAAAMRRFVDENPQDRFGRHEYSGAEYGLDPETIREEFAGYIERHGLGAPAARSGGVRS